MNCTTNLIKVVTRSFRNSTKSTPILHNFRTSTDSVMSWRRNADREEVDLSIIRSDKYTKDSWSAPPFVFPREDHAVLFELPPPQRQNGAAPDRPPKPLRGEDQWNEHFVKLPCNYKNQYNGERRWDIINRAFSARIRSVKELAATIISYNRKYEKEWRFTALEKLVDDMAPDESSNFFNVIIPNMVRLALDLPNLVKSPIPLLKKGSNYSVSLTQQQISCLLANAFFCTFPYRNSESRDSEYAHYPNINFSKLFKSEGDDVVQKLKCFLHYFRRVTQGAPPPGVVTFARRSVPYEEMPSWAHSSVPIRSVPVRVVSQLAFEEADGVIQLDFANKYLGGGVLGHGSVQEEIRFAISPELVVSKLFIEVLADNEAVLMIGPERYSEYLGYSRSFEWSGKYTDATPYDARGRRRVAVLAIDALPFRNRQQEYRRRNVERELNKAWVGFSFYDDKTKPINFPGVATGNWGCGAFGGSPQLKSLLQLMACAQARRPMAYATYGDETLRDQLLDLHALLVARDVTVGQLYRYIMDFAEHDHKLTELFAFLERTIKKPRKTTIRTWVKGKTTRQASPDQIHRALQSPDLFSQDDDDADTQTHEQSQEITSSTNRKRKLNSMTDDSYEAATKTKVSSHTSRFFEAMQKLEDDKEIKLSVSHTTPVKRKSCGSESTRDIDEKAEIVASKMARTVTKTASQTIRPSIFEQMQKLNDYNEKIDSDTQTTPDNHGSSIKFSDSESSRDSDVIAESVSSKMAAIDTEMASQTHEQEQKLLVTRTAPAEQKFIIILSDAESSRDIDEQAERASEMAMPSHTFLRRQELHDCNEKIVTQAKITDKRISGTLCDSESSKDSDKVVDLEYKMAATETKMASQTSRLLEYNEKLDIANELINVSIAQPPATNQRTIILDNSDESKRSKECVVNPEVKRIRRKITDYFSRHL